jgi:hypothetical protein
MTRRQDGSHPRESVSSATISARLVSEAGQCHRDPDIELVHLSPGPRSTSAIDDRAIRPSLHQ